MKEMQEEEKRGLIYHADQISQSKDGDYFEKILIECIDTSKNIRKFDEESEKFVALVDSINNEGLLSPIVIKEHKGNIVCISGHRRIAAFKSLGRKVIPAIFRKGNMIDTRNMAFAANEIVEEMTVLEKAGEYLKWEKRGLRINEIAKRVGKDRTTVSRMLKIAKWNKEIHKVIEQKNLSYRKLEALARKSLSEDEVLEALLGGEAKNEFSPSELRKKSRIDLAFEDLNLDSSNTDLFLSFCENIGFLSKETYMKICGQENIN
ncbi:MAG: ParB/RepB/Spo0J family partition protein [Oligoflexales bacterium]